MPLAGPVLLAGLRVVSVSTVSLVSVGALIGVSSLGSLFTDGYRRDFGTEIVAGVIGTVVLALVFDLILVAWTHPHAVGLCARARAAVGASVAGDTAAWLTDGAHWIGPRASHTGSSSTSPTQPSPSGCRR